MPNTDLAPSIQDEAARISRRRAHLGLEAGSGYSGKAMGLSLSGGGIRSATFCLGVLQALTRAASPRPSTGASATSNRLLRGFDYLSTVSGGGYIGAFFASLFVPGRLNATGDSRNPPPADANEQLASAERAYRVFETDPPGRLRGDIIYEDREPGRAPLAWLRENGRYLTPTGAGDLMYAIAMTVRNWFAMHYVLGTWLLLAAGLVALSRQTLIAFCRPWTEFEQDLHAHAFVDSTGAFSSWGIWWSPLWLLPLVFVLLRVIPSGVAFWLTYPGPGQTLQSSPNLWSKAVWGALGVAAALLLSAWTMSIPPFAPGWQHIKIASIVLASIIVLSVWCHWRSATTKAGDAETGSISISGQRVHLTRFLSNGLQILLGLALLAALDTAAQTAYLWMREPHNWSFLAALMTGAIWIVRNIAEWSTEKSRPNWVGRMPLNVVAGVAGSLLLFIVATLWFVLIQIVVWHDGLPYLEGRAAESEAIARILAAGGASVFALGLAWLSGQFPGFLNLSTFQSLYSARLTRAYLGASNGERFAQPADRTSPALRSVAEPHPSDQLSHEAYYGSNECAPLHIINVCLNQTSDRSEQLVQRDRKGKPLAVLPGGFMVDGVPYPFKQNLTTELGRSLSIGEWISVSGAAFTTGLGRTTSLGLSLLLGLANMRLGRWWPSGVEQANPQQIGWLERMALKIFPTQIHLCYEFLARFHGLHRRWQYLSDGGHFENTGIYELLRRERAVNLIVACDCGADPRYEFGDLANLIRLARIDMGIEIVVDRDAAEDRALKPAFGVPEDFAAAVTAGTRPEKCAVLLKAYQPGQNKDTDPPATWIVLLKPAPISGIPWDLSEYAVAHPAFPQEPTSDQFFDEAQWESYRRLGLEIGRRVFGESAGPTSNPIAAALWRRLGYAS